MSSISLSLAIASNHPIKLAEFYAFATNGQLELGENKYHCKVILRDGLMIHLYKPSRNEPIPNKGRALSLCLQQEASIQPLITIKEWAGLLASGGAELAKEPTLETFGAEAWMTDPEGNDFLICVPII